MPRTQQNQSEHDNVVCVSATTYSQLEQQGYKVDTNPGQQKNRQVGSSEPYSYPDVIVWKPSSPGSSSGTAVIIEEIETTDTVTSASVQQWQEYASLGVSTFRLIVPSSHAEKALDLVRQHSIKVTEIWYYENRNTRITFTKYYPGS